MWECTNQGFKYKKAHQIVFNHEIVCVIFENGLIEHYIVLSPMYIAQNRPVKTARCAIQTPAVDNKWKQ